MPSPALTLVWLSGWVWLCPWVEAQYESEPVHVEPTAASHALEFYDFVTRPDIIAPRWDVKVHDKDAISPGYWFASFYETFYQLEGDNKHWLGPRIYDGNGELIWSGVSLLDGFILNDFRVSNVGGANMLTGIDAYHTRALIIDDRYQIHQEFHLPGDNGQGPDRHDVQTVEDGTKVLVLASHYKVASPTELRTMGLDDECDLRHGGFQEFDIATGELVFDWTSEGRISLDETYRDHDCLGFRDYVHVNSIDKFPDGDYLLSCRYTDAVYRISSKDSSIIWRFGGKKSDFDFDGIFSGQHSVRILSQNTTHIIISAMDNASRPGTDSFTNDRSRGMILALHTDTSPMTAEILQTFEHPQGGYVTGRGNLQILENENAFAGWWNNSRLSEYAPDGRLIMEAQLRSVLRSYRDYKFEWKGYPQEPPDVYSMALANGGDEEEGYNSPTTVFVSWNGATEVAYWALYRADASGQSMELISSAPRNGFETRITHRGYVEHVVVEAFDRDDNLLGRSGIVATVSQTNGTPSDVSDKVSWTIDPSSRVPLTSVLSSFSAVYVLGILICINVAVFVGLLCCVQKRTRYAGTRWRWRQSRHHGNRRYQALTDTDSEADMASNDQKGI